MPEAFNKMLGIVILNYETWHKTRACIDTIRKTYLSPCKIIVVDNDSKNDSYEILKDEYRYFSNTAVIKTEKNIGYAAGNNLGIRAAIDNGSDALLVSNNDVIFTAGAIDIMYDYIRNNYSVGLVSPAIYRRTGKHEGGRAGLLGIKEKYFVTTPLRYLDLCGNYRKYFYMDLPIDQKHTIVSPSGSCFMIRREVIETIGFLDENTFLYEEEAILGRQLLGSSYEAVYLPSARIIHEGGGTTRRYRPDAFVYFIKSEIYYCSKYLGMSFKTYFPLYIIRLMQFISRWIIYGDFRKGALYRINLTWRELKSRMK